MQNRPSKESSKYPYPIILIITLVFTLIPVSAWCQKSYKLAVFPEYYPIVIYEKCTPLISYLNEKLDAKFQLVIPKNINEYMRLVKEEKVDFSYQNPYVFFQLRSQVQALVITEKGKKWGIESRGVIISKKGKGINKVDDLIGKRINIVSRYSADGFIAQEMLLKGMMINLGTDYSVYENNPNSHGSVLVNVLKEDADAGFLSEEVLLEPDPSYNLYAEELKRINVVAVTGFIPNWIFCARKKLNPAFVNDVKEVLLNIPLDSEVSKSVKIRRFVQIPSNYLEEYESKVK